MLCFPLDKYVAGWTGRSADLPDSVTVGTTVDLEVSVRPAQFEPGAEITSVAADLSDLGGPARVPLTDRGDGTYALETSLTMQVSGLRNLSIGIEQATSLGTHWIGLSRDLAVRPVPAAADLVILDERIGEGIRLQSAWGADLPQVVDTGPALTGERSGAFTVGLPDVPNIPSWEVWLVLDEPVDPLAYGALAFAFHPGETHPSVVWDEEVVRLSATVNEREVDLLEGRVDLRRPEWQEVVIPLEEWHLTGPLWSIGFIGMLEGTFYVDHLRLVVSSSQTAVLEEYTSSLPQSFTLSQNYPNLFNSATVIRFALPTAADVDLTIFNLAGQRVATLADGVRAAGSYTLRWDGCDDDERALASGVYLYRLQVGQQWVETRKLALMK